MPHHTFTEGDILVAEHENAPAPPVSENRHAQMSYGKVKRVCTP